MMYATRSRLVHLTLGRIDGESNETPVGENLKDAPPVFTLGAF